MHIDHRVRIECHHADDGADGSATHRRAKAQVNICANVFGRTHHVDLSDLGQATYDVARYTVFLEIPRAPSKCLRSAVWSHCAHNDRGHVNWSDPKEMPMVCVHEREREKQSFQFTPIHYGAPTIQHRRPLTHDSISRLSGDF